jgi:diphthine synthase
MLYLIGLGLHDEKDLSLKAIEAIKSADEVYAEIYTSNWHGDFSIIEEITGKEIKILEREDIESDFLMGRAGQCNVVLLVPGDPLAATTHTQFLIDGKRAGIEVKVIHSSSIYSSIAESGLQLYKFGRATTIASPEKGFNPTSPYEIIAENHKMGLHSLVLLCLKGTGVHMSIRDGLELLLGMEERKKENVINKETKVVACCDLGCPKQKILYGSILHLMEVDPKKVPAVILVPGKLNFKEEEALEMHKC